MEHSFTKRYLIKLLANIINGIINIVLVAIVPKALGPVAYGQFIYVQQFFSQIIAFLDAGTSTAFFTKLSAKNTRKELISFYFFFSIGLLLSLFVLIYSVDIFGYANLLLPDVSSDYIYLGLWFCFFTWAAQVFIKISDAYALTVSVELIKIAHKVVTLFLLIGLIGYTAFDLNIYFYFHLFSLLSFLAILSFLFFKREIFIKNLITLPFALKKMSQEFFTYCSPLFVFNIIAIAIGLFDIWLLQKISGSVETGFYGLAYSIAAMCFLFTSSMTPLITREFSKSFEENDFEKVKNIFQRYIPMLYTIAAYFSVFIAFQAENLLLIFTDDKFKDALFVLMVMAFYPIHQTYGQLSGSLFFATNDTKLYRNIGLVSSLIGLFFSFIFIYFLEWGALGFGIKMILAQLIGVNIQLYFNVKLLNLKMSYFVMHQVYSVIILSLLAYASANILVFDKIMYEFLFSGFIYTLGVITVIFFYPSIIAVPKEKLMKFLGRKIEK
ncbi:lipopolysaccharide biosynthesis protein [Aliarcobacter butzleri]|uniref:lipopolysaccharide biosynthesis protein n=1 Tax=Aliarcobacter butzleri TaxID=28197 RepID=UPI000318236F|nr:oligosaccharide flippase family protein [Aliarcobacter butzleri]QDM00888.1 oligosaccharide flippase family protein [Aliarcobacter butzleri]UWY60832.1 oligosaccharide flippase family protein [Aliarcobacter butzleri]